MAAKILLTAFEPFGLHRLVGEIASVFGAGGPRNASLDVLNEIRARSGDRFEYLILPVRRECESIFEDCLDQTRPSGIISMGETDKIHRRRVNIEPYAVRAPLAAFSMGGGMEFVESSPFVRGLGIESKSEIGRYYCNRIYLTGLRWANGRRPAAFIHIPLAGSSKVYARQVMGCVEAMAARLSV